MLQPLHEGDTVLRVRSVRSTLTDRGHEELVHDRKMPPQYFQAALLVHQILHTVHVSSVSKQFAHSFHKTIQRTLRVSGHVRGCDRSDRAEPLVPDRCHGISQIHIFRIHSLCALKQSSNIIHVALDVRKVFQDSTVDGFVHSTEISTANVSQVVIFHDFHVILHVLLKFHTEMYEFTYGMVLRYLYVRARSAS